MQCILVMVYTHLYANKVIFYFLLFGMTTENIWPNLTFVQLTWRRPRLVKKIWILLIMLLCRSFKMHSRQLCMLLLVSSHNKHVSSAKCSNSTKISRSLTIMRLQIYEEWSVLRFPIILYWGSFF